MLYLNILFSCVVFLLAMVQTHHACDRLSTKLQGSRIHPTSFPLEEHRLYTPNSVVFVGKKAMQLDSKDDTTLHLYQKHDKAHVIVTEHDRSIGCMATTEIKTATARKQEKKSTTIQYDKEKTKTKKKDFPIDPTNYSGHVNYQGGHLIDHKYSAGTSHHDERNYIPMHYFYNAPLKEHLVKLCEEYIGIPLYTDNPPRIAVKNSTKYHDIPIGIMFLQLEHQEIKGAYYFPNNAYDYQALKERLDIKKDIEATIAPLFKLKKAFHALFKPAFIHDLKKGHKKAQKKNEHD